MVDRCWLCNKVCCNCRDVIKCDSPTYFYFVRSCFYKNTTDQRIHNTSLTLGPEDTQHIHYTGTRGHTTHPLHWDQRTHNISLNLGPEDTQHIPHTGTRGHTTHPSHWDQRTHNTSLTLGPEDTQHIPHTGTRGHTTHPSHWDQRTHNTSLTLEPEDTQHVRVISCQVRQHMHLMFQIWLNFSIYIGLHMIPNLVCS